MKWRIFHKKETVSTNLDARKGRSGDVFTADFQSAGRGRLDHKWLSAPDDNLMMSVVLDVADLPPEQVATLPLAVGLAVLRGLSPLLGLSADRASGRLALKWPNDMLVEGRKIAGILCERQGDAVIAGLGVNVNQREFAAEIADRATSLAAHGCGVSVVAVRDSVLSALAEVYATWRGQGFAAVYPELAAFDFLRGRYLEVLQTDDDRSPVKGICGGIGEDGSLQVGGVRVYAGEAHVTHLGV